MGMGRGHVAPSLSLKAAAKCAILTSAGYGKGGGKMSDPLHALRQAIAAIKAGDKAAGRRLLAAVIRENPRDEAAWLWMSAAIDVDEQRRTCLERVLAINPDNATARRGLASLGPTLGGTGPTFGRTGPASQPPGLASPGTPPPAGQALPSAGQARPSAGQARPSAGQARPSAGQARPSAGQARPSVGQARPSVGQARRARAVLPWWSLLIAFGATVAVCATIGIAAYLALSGVVGFLRSRTVRSTRRRARHA
jgi:hypothetical protein